MYCFLSTILNTKTLHTVLIMLKSCKPYHSNDHWWIKHCRTDSWIGVLRRSQKYAIYTTTGSIVVGGNQGVPGGNQGVSEGNPWQYAGRYGRRILPMGIFYIPLQQACLRIDVGVKFHESVKQFHSTFCPTSTIFCTSPYDRTAVKVNRRYTILLWTGHRI